MTSKGSLSKVINEQDALLDAGTKDDTASALACVTRLFEDMHGGTIHNFQLKSPLDSKRRLNPSQQPAFPK